MIATNRISWQQKVSLIINFVVFGYDKDTLKILLVKSDGAKNRPYWSLAGGILQRGESLNSAARRILRDVVYTPGAYMEPLGAFDESSPYQGETSISMGYLSMLNIEAYREHGEGKSGTQWVVFDGMPEMPAGHRRIVDAAIEQLRYKASQHPILFELLPEKFTLPQLQTIYENIYGKLIDHRNFHRKIMTLGLLIKQQDKDTNTSKRGAYFYTFDKAKYVAGFNHFLNIVPHENTYIFLKQ